MPLSKRAGNRFNANIWPGFVDAMTALLLVLTFVLSIFMIVQFVLRETISGQGEELDALGLQVSELSKALGLEQGNNAALEDRVSSLQSLLATAEGDIANLQGTVSSFEQQVAGLLSQQASLEADKARLEANKADLEDSKAKLEANKADLENAQKILISEKEAVQLALANARSEIDEQSQAARLAAAKREALEALIADLEGNLDDTQKELSETEKNRLAEIAAANLLRDRLKDSQTELTAMTLALEAKRKDAEDQLTLLAAAKLAKDQLEALSARTVDDATKKAALLAQANTLLSTQQAANVENQRKIALLNQQTLELRKQLNQLQGLLDDAAQKDTESQIQMQALGNNLNTALARVAAEQKKRAALEQAERERLEKEAKNLEQFRSEFFGRVRQLLEGQEGVRIVGDRFVFSSEVLFAAGSATLGAGGQAELRKVSEILRSVANEIPSEIDWILRVDGHTDRTPIRTSPIFADNWELSQARALSVVKYLIDPLGIPANRLAANGFGEFQPIDPSDTPQAYATNRRIELKFTEK